MLKKILLAVVICIAAVSANAQSFKFGNINMGEVFEAMPERAQVQKDLEDLQAKYETELSKMGDEHQNKVSAFLADQEKLEESIKEARAQEINQLEQRINNFREMAARDLQTQQQTKIAPIIEKINKAVQTVGEKNGFTYIFDLSQGNILFVSPSQCVDCLPLVKAELGIK